MNSHVDLAMSLLIDSFISLSVKLIFTLSERMPTFMGDTEAMGI